MFTLLVIIITLLTIYYYNRQKKDKNFPPGPQGLPIVGYLPFMRKDAPRAFANMSKKYGPVFSVQFGLRHAVVINDYENIQEALVKQGNAFSGRPFIPLAQALGGGHGIIFRDYGNHWKSQRKFGITTLRGIGVGKRSMEERITEEIQYLRDAIIAQEGKSFDCQSVFANAISNVICSIVMGSRFDYEDRSLKNIVDCIGRIFGPGNHAVLSRIVTTFPVLRYLPVFRRTFTTRVKDFNIVLDILRDMVQQHKRDFDDNNIRDFTDQFLKEMYRETNQDKSFIEDQLFHYIRDLFVAGTETTTSTLRWCILGFAYYPKSQEKIVEEIYAVIGESGIPSMGHRKQMPYTCAYIQEIMRHRTMLPFSVTHKTSTRTILCGYDIPQNTTILPNIWAVHNDAEHFKDPEAFKPERFLDSSGKFVPCNRVIPFSIGPRHCLGEQLANMEIFLFLTSIVQKFEIRPDPGNLLPPFNKVTFILLDGPGAFKLRFHLR